MSRIRFPVSLFLVLLALVPASRAGALPTVEEPASSTDLERLRAQVQALEDELERRHASAEAGARIADLERRIEILTRELEKLRIGEPAPTPTTGSHGVGPAAAKVYGVANGVSIGGYGEMVFSRSAGSSQLDFVRAVLYTGYKFRDSIVFNSEVELEHASTGEGGEVSVEFAYLDFLWRPELNVRAGLVLLPVGLVNELHEPTTYLGSFRPRTEQQILPSTWRENGVGVYGERGDWRWRAFLVNGLEATGYTVAGLRGGRQKGSEALADDLAFAGRLDFEPALSTLLGVSLYRGDAAQRQGGFSAPTTIFDLHGQFRDRGLEVRALYARAGVGDVAEINAAKGLEGASIARTLQGGYLQVGYDVLARCDAGEHELIPYLRFEKVLPQSEVPAGLPRDRSQNLRLVTLGVAWKPIAEVVVKADWSDVDRETGQDFDEFRMQMGYIF